MTRATLVAALAGVLAAAGIAELVAALVARSAHPRAPARRRGRAAGLAARVGRRVGVPAPPGDLATRMAAAGVPVTVGVADVMAAKAGGAVLGAAVAAPLAAAVPIRLGLAVLLASGAAGFLGPDLWLRRRARHRARHAALELADVLDLLRVAVEAGLPSGRALGEVGRRRDGVVGAELRAVAARVELGVARSAALAELRRRLPLPEVAALVAALDRADRHGAPLGPSLAALATEARFERARALRDRAAAAAPRIQLAVALLLVPAVLLLVAAALVHGLA